MLLISAAHLLDDAATPANGAAQLACLTAADALGAGPTLAAPAPFERPVGLSAHSQIREALAVLGELPAEAFADLRTRNGARYARRALRQLT